MKVIKHTLLAIMLLGGLTFNTCKKSKSQTSIPVKKEIATSDKECV
jgi:hypothetical protein